MTNLINCKYGNSPFIPSVSPGCLLYPSPTKRKSAINQRQRLCPEADNVSEQQLHHKQHTLLALFHTREHMLMLQCELKSFCSSSAKRPSALKHQQSMQLLAANPLQSYLKEQLFQNVLRSSLQHPYLICPCLEPRTVEE